MSTDQNYEQYGLEWEAEMLKFTKPQLAKTFGVDLKDEFGLNRTKTEMVRVIKEKLNGEADGE
jgi:putative sterol carrier protein